MPIRNNLPDIWRGERGVWNPIREMSRLQRRIDRMFDDFYNEPFPSLSALSRDFLPLEGGEFTPACDLGETDTHYLISFDLPGVKKEDVKIELQDHQLTVSGERKEEVKGRGSRERYYGAFSRSFTLPTNVDTNKLEANYENGVLQISVKKTAASVGKQIPIKEGKLIEAKAEKAA